MALNLNRIAAAYKAITEKSSSSGNYGSSLFWRPEPGEHLIRMVPYKYDMEFPFIELKQYYIFGKVPVTSPLTFGEVDPIDQFANELINRPNATKDEKDMGYKLRPKTRIVVPIIVRGHESEGVKFWTIGAKVYQALVTLMQTSDYGDITDLQAGHDLSVTIKRGEQLSDNETTILPKPAKTPVYSDAEMILKKLNETPDFLNTIVSRKTPEDMVAYLEDYLARASSVQSKPESSVPQMTSFAAMQQQTTTSPPPTANPFSSFGAAATHQPSVTQPTDPKPVQSAVASSEPDIKAKFASMFGGQK